MSAFPKTVNELPADFLASLDMLDPKHQKKAPLILEARQGAKGKFELLMRGEWQGLGYPSQSEADEGLCGILVHKVGPNAELIDRVFRSSGLMRDKWDVVHVQGRTYGQATIARVLENHKPTVEQIDPERWRDFCKSFGQLTTEEPRYIVEQLIPEGAMSAITGHSFHSKTWVALMIALAISKGTPLWNYFKVAKALPVIYHCPEMSEAMVRHYLHVLEADDDENLLVRPMEAGVWPLDDPLFVHSSVGRVAFLDTGGFFNPADDGNDYKQALQFAKLVFDAITAGCLGVVPLFHLAKGVKKEEWSLENSIIGSAGYGAMLRSCLRVFNMNPDLNDPQVHLYLQGMKNPGLKPFQLVGPAPLEMKVKPGDSPYLKVLLSGDRDYIKASEMFEKGATQREVAEQLTLSLGKVNKLHKRWEGKSEIEENDGPSY